MGKAKQKKRTSQIKRKQMVEEVFKKGKKLREIAKKFDEKLVKKGNQGPKRSLNKKKPEGNFNREHVAQLDKEFDHIRANRKPGQSII